MVSKVEPSDEAIPFIGVQAFGGDCFASLAMTGAGGGLLGRKPRQQHAS